MRSVDDVRAALDSYLAEGLALRACGELPGSGAAPSEVLDALLDTRRRLDRVEELLGRAIRLRARAHRASTLAAHTADDAWDRASQQVREHARNVPVTRRSDEFLTGKERAADTNLAVLDQRLAARQAAELAHACDEAVDVLRLTHRGLDGVRQDLLSILRTLAFESHLER